MSWRGLVVWSRPAAPAPECLCCRVTEGGASAGPDREACRRRQLPFTGSGSTPRAEARRVVLIDRVERSVTKPAACHPRLPLPVPVETVLTVSGSRGPERLDRGTARSFSAPTPTGSPRGSEPGFPGSLPPAVPAGVGDVYSCRGGSATPRSKIPRTLFPVVPQRLSPHDGESFAPCGRTATRLWTACGCWLRTRWSAPGPGCARRRRSRPQLWIVRYRLSSGARRGIAAGSSRTVVLG